MSPYPPPRAARRGLVPFSSAVRFPPARGLYAFPVEPHHDRRPDAEPVAAAMSPPHILHFNVVISHHSCDCQSILLSCIARYSSVPAAWPSPPVQSSSAMPIFSLIPRRLSSYCARVMTPRSRNLSRIAFCLRKSCSVWVFRILSSYCSLYNADLRGSCGTSQSHRASLPLRLVGGPTWHSGYGAR